MDRSLAIKKKAQALVQKGQVDAALAEFDRLFEGGDKDPYDFILVADLLAKRGSMQEAVRRYRQAIDEYSKAELFKNAIAVCKKILRISKEDLEIHRSLGDLYAKEGLFGDSQIHYLEFAEGSIRRHDHDAALDVLEKVLQLSPDNLDLSEKFIEISTRADQPERGGRELLRRAERAEHRGQMDEAGQLRERASTLSPGLSVSVTPRSERGASPGGPEEGAASGGDALDSSARGFGDFTATSIVSDSDAATVPEPGVLSSGAFEIPVTGADEPAPAPGEPGVFEEGQPEPGPAATQAPGEAAARHEDLAAGYLSSGNLELAAEEFWKAAEVAFFRGDLVRARTLLDSLLQVMPNHEAALRRLVDITVQAEDQPAEARARFSLAELYLSHEEWALARAEYMRVLELDSTNDRARKRVQRLDSMANGDGTTLPVDLDSLPSQRPAASVRVRDEQPAAIDSLVDLEEIIDEFKAGVSNSISGEDHESHYDLGMAYMEMGLYDEAIGEFQTASKGGPMELKCLEMIALCYLEKSEPTEAARELQRALELPGHGPDETISIRYNLGIACERLGDLDRALQHFEEVYLLNVDFLKVAAKVRELKQRIATSKGS